VRIVLNEFDRGSTLLQAVRIVLNEFGRGSTLLQAVRIVLNEFGRGSTQYNRGDGSVCDPQYGSQRLNQCFPEVLAVVDLSEKNNALRFADIRSVLVRWD